MSKNLCYECQSDYVICFVCGTPRSTDDVDDDLVCIWCRKKSNKSNEQQDE